jgi:hypothetical protein
LLPDDDAKDVDDFNLVPPDPQPLAQDDSEMDEVVGFCEADLPKGFFSIFNEWDRMLLEVAVPAPIFPSILAATGNASEVVLSADLALATTETEDNDDGDEEGGGGGDNEDDDGDGAVGTETWAGPVVELGLDDGDDD